MIIPYSWNNNNAGNEKNEAITSLIESAAEIALSENMKAFKFQPKETTGLQNKATLAIVVFDYIPEGETITFSFLNSTVTLEASLTPTSGQFWTESGAPSSTDYYSIVAESIADALLKVLSFESNYNLTGAGSGLTITAKEYGEEFNISLTTTANLNHSSSAGTAKYESQNYIDYSCWAELYIADNIYCDSVDKFQAIKVDEYLIDSRVEETSISANPVKNYVNPILPVRNLIPSNDFFKMDSGTTGSGVVIPTEGEDGLRRFTLRPYFLIYGDSYRFIENGQRKRFVRGVTPIRWVQLGAFDKLRPYNMQNFVWLPIALGSFNWLTSCPNRKTVTYDSHEYLQVIMKKFDTGATASPQITITYYDGSQEIVVLESFNTANIGGNLSFDVSPVALDLENKELMVSKYIKEYEFKIKYVTPSSDRLESAPKTYVFDRNLYLDKRQVIFLNEFGGWDSLEFTGAIQENISKEKTTITRPIPFDANKETAISKEVRINTATIASTKFSLHSGLMSQEHFLWCKKLIESSAVYIWNNKINSYESIIIEDYTYKSDTNDGSGSISIQYTRTVSNNTINR